MRTILPSSLWPKLTTAAVLISAVILSFGCSQDEAEIAISGAITVAGCKGVVVCDAPRSFSLDDGFAAMVVSGSTAEIRLQQDARRPVETDALIIQVRDVDRIDLGQSVAVGPDELVRAGLVLQAGCDSQPASVQLRGTMTFTAFGTTDTARIAARLSLTTVETRPPAEGQRPCRPGEIGGQFDFKRSARAADLGRR